MKFGRKKKEGFREGDLVPEHDKTVRLIHDLILYQNNFITQHTPKGDSHVS